MLKIKKEYFIGFIMMAFIIGFFIGGSGSVQEGINKADTMTKEVGTSQEEEGKDDNPRVLYDVLEVVDGDTVKIDYEGKKTSVRIVGMNSPETDGPYRETECFGREASEQAKDLLGGKRVSLEFEPNTSKFDKFGRLLAYVLIDGNDFGLQMIKQGYAYEYTYQGQEYKNKKKYKEAQKYAEENSLGL